MIGLPAGFSLDQTVELFRDTQAAGLIVFRRNFPGAAGFRAWLQALEERLERRLLVAVDHEGGRVIHFEEGVTYFPDNLVLGWTGSEDYAARQGRIEAAELRRLGIDLNLAPTVDVLTAAYSPNIGIRSYGADASLAARLGSARIRAMQEAGLSACAKHFPGQGQSSLDAHLDLPVLPTTREEFDAVHGVPFRAAIEAGVDAVMTSHPVYPHLEKEKQEPATFSEAIVTGLLRRALKFDGMILSDDLEMGALKHYGSIGDCAVRAVKAGHDMVLICSRPEASREAALKLAQAYQEGVLKPAGAEATAARLAQLQARRSRRFSDERAYPEPDGMELALTIARQGLAGRQKAAQPVQRRTGAKTLVLYPRLSELNSRIAFEKNMSDDEAFIRSLFAARDGVSFLCLGMDPDEEEQNRAFKEAEKADETIFFCFDPHLDGQSRALLQSLEKRVTNLVVVFLRDPFGHELLNGRTPYLHALGFRSAQIRAAAEMLML